MTTTRRFRAIIGLTVGLGAVMATMAADRGVPPETEDGAVAIARLIDREVDRKLAEAGARALPEADDSEFLRRAYLDLSGVIPPGDRALAFLESRDPRKRDRLVDELLEGPRFARHMAETWQSLLMIRDSSNRRLKGEPLVAWLEERFDRNEPWDRTVRDLLTATGTQEENGANTFFIALRTPDKLNDQVTRLFLGVNLQCAQCHDHPFSPWKRDDYWSMAAFFSKVRAGGKKVGLAKNGVESVNEEGLGKKAPLPDSALDRSPRFLGGEKPAIKSGDPFRPSLAKWLTAAENPFFARAMVNRTWAQLLGRGLVDPVDNINDFASASHPELFEGLTRQFVASGFDLRQLIRGIARSRAYGRASGGPPESSESAPLFARAVVRPMTPEQLYDSLVSIIGTPDDSSREARRAARKAARKADANTPRSKFVAFFDTPDGTDPGEYATGIPQVLRLMNSPEMNRQTAFLDGLQAAGRTPAQALDRLYLSTLARHPSPAERDRIAAYLDHQKREPREEFADLLWVLLNSSEFALNH
jgi:hypothetical protein